MAGQYHPKRILQLLTISSWKSENELSFSGFSKLENKINSHKVESGTSNETQDISQKYLNDLFLDVKKNIESGESIGKNATHIHSILNYIGFDTWEKFEEKCISIECFLKSDSIDFEENRILILGSDPIFEEKFQNLTFLNKTVKPPLVYENNIGEVSNIIHVLKTFTEKNPFIIWLISEDWDSKLKELKDNIIFKNLVYGGQIIPVRIGKELAQQKLTASFLNQKETLSGEMGFFMALSLITLQNFSFSTKQKEDNKNTPRTVIKNLNNTGVIYMGDIEQNIEGGNIAMGNLIQNINSEKNKN